MECSVRARAYSRACSCGRGVCVAVAMGCVMYFSNKGQR